MGVRSSRAGPAVAIAAALVGAGLIGTPPAAGAPAAAEAPAKPYDFNGDGFQDLALGSPYGDVGSVVNAGFISVVYGSATGLTTAHKVINQNSPGIPGAAEAEDQFGYALTSADYNQDGYADLAVGVPGEDTNEGADAGYDTIIWGTPSGLADLAAGGIEPVGAAAGHGYGWSMTTGDLNGDGSADLVATAIGTPDFYWFSFAATSAAAARSHGTVKKANVRLPAAARAAAATPGVNAFYVATGDVNGDDIDDLALGWRDDDEAEPVAKAGFAVWAGGSDTLTGGEPIAAAGIRSIAVGDFQGDGNADVAVGQTDDTPRLGGQVAVFAGGAGGVSGPAAYIRAQGAGIPGTAKADDRLGGSLAAADANGDSRADLAVGAPYKDLGALADAGEAVMLYGSATGLTGGQVFTQDTGAVPGTAEANDQFGYNVALIDHNADGKADLSAGAPRENGYEGYIDVLKGAAAGITPNGSIAFGTGVLGVPGTTAQIGLRIGR